MNTYISFSEIKNDLQRTWQVLLLLILALSACSIQSVPEVGLEPQANLWLSMTDNQGLDIAQSNSTFNPSLTTRSDGTPFLAWEEAGNIYVKYWVNGYWYSYNTNQPLDINVANTSNSPSIAGGGFVTWQETDSVSSKVYVKRWNAVTNTWVSLGAVNVSLTQNAHTPSLAYHPSNVFQGDSIVVAWRESDNIYVKRWDWNTNTWVFFGQAGLLDKHSNSLATDPALLLDSVGNPIVTWSEWDGSSWNIYVKRWSAGAWTFVGLALDKVPSATTINPSIALDNAGNPVVAWAEVTATDRDVYVKRWNGSSWLNYSSGQAIDKVMGNFVSEPSIKINSSNQPIVSWREEENVRINQTIYTKQWNGSAWVLLGSALDIQIANPAYSPTLALRNDTPLVAWVEQTGSSYDLFAKQYRTQAWTPYGGTIDVTLSKWAQAPSLDLNSTDRPVVAWYESDFTNPASVYVKRWNGITWLPYSGAINTNPASYPSLALDSTNRPFVALSESVGGQGTLYVKRWSGTTWVNLGTAIETNSPTFQQPKLELDNTDRAVVAWAKNASSSDLYVARREGNAWVQLGAVLDRTLSNQAAFYDLAIDVSNRPVIVWQEQDATQSNIYVKRWNGTAWINLGNALDISVARDTSGPSIAIGIDGNPVVAWTETINNSFFRVYVKRWNGNAWVAIGSFVGTGFAPSIDIENTDNPVVAYNQSDASTNFQGNVYVKRWDGSAWRPIGKTVDRNDLGALANSPMLALTSTDKPIIAWSEQPYNNSNLYVSSY